MGVSLKELIEVDLIQPGEAVLEVIYQGSCFRAELTPTGTIVFQGNTFETPSGWALSVIRSINPGRKAVDGWKSVKYKGQLLEELSAKYAGDELAKEDLQSDDDSPYGNTRNRTKSLRDLSARDDYAQARSSPKRDDHRSFRNLHRCDDNSRDTKRSNPIKDETTAVVRRSARLVTSRTSGSDTIGTTYSAGHKQIAAAKGQGQYILTDGSLYDLPEHLADLDGDDDYPEDYCSERMCLEECSEREFYDDWCSFMCSQGRRAEVEKWVYCRFHLNYRPLDIFGLYKAVTSRGGWPGRKSKKELESEGGRARRLKGNLSWEGDIFRQMRNYRHGHHATSVGNMLITYYENLLVDYEKCHPEDIWWYQDGEGECCAWYCSGERHTQNTSRATDTPSVSDVMGSEESSGGEEEEEMDTGATAQGRGGPCGMDMLLRCMEMEGQAAAQHRAGGVEVSGGDDQGGHIDTGEAKRRLSDSAVAALLREAKRRKIETHDAAVGPHAAASIFRKCVATVPQLKDGEKMVLGQVMSREVADIYDKSRNSYLRTVVDSRNMVAVLEGCSSASSSGSSIINASRNTSGGSALAGQLDAHIRNAVTAKRNSVTIDIPHQYLSAIPHDLPVHPSLETVTISHADHREWLRGKEVLRVRRNVSSIPSNTVLGPYRGYMDFWQQYQEKMEQPPAGWLGGGASWKMALEDSTYQLQHFNPAQKEGTSSYLDRNKWEEQYTLMSSSMMYGNALSLAVDPRTDPMNYPHEHVTANSSIVEFQVGHWAFPFLVSRKTIRPGEEVEIDRGSGFWKVQRCRQEAVETSALLDQVVEVARNLRHTNSILQQDIIAMKRKYSTLQFDLAAVQRDMVEVRNENALLHEQTADAMSRQCAAAMDIGDLIDKSDKLRQELEEVKRERDALVSQAKDNAVTLQHVGVAHCDGPSDSEGNITTEELPSEKENQLPEEGDRQGPALEVNRNNYLEPATAQQCMLPDASREAAMEATKLLPLCRGDGPSREIMIME